VENNYQPVGCGLPYTAMIYMYSYILIVSVTFLNLFIAVILDGYFNTVEGEKQMFNSTKLHHFKHCWSKYDPDATGLIMEQNL